nr:sugar ABC transporter substrate-binding protein [Actinomycetales bacterium]
MRNTRRNIVAVAALAALALGACSQGGATDPTSAPAGGEETTSAAASGNEETGEVEEPGGDLPAPFSDGGLKIAIVQNTGQGDYFQQYLNGTTQQAAALDIELDVYDAQGDNANQASQLDQAIASGVDGIIVRHGFADTLCPGVNEAIDMGIPVVIYDVEIQQCAPRAVQTQQSDEFMASLVLDQMVEEVGQNVKVGYVNVLGIAPLDRRDAVWNKYKEENNWEEVFFTGRYSASTASDTAPMVDAALKANPDVAAIYAPYDELTKATLTALEQNPDIEGVLVYGADISTADIELMVAEGSPWRGTGATDPNAIGAAVTRTLFLLMADELDTLNVEFPPVLVTQDFLRDNGIQNMDDLRANMVELNISDVSSSEWLPSVTF